jgi:hypothetical protein
MMIPKKVFPNTLMSNPHYEQEIKAMCRDLILNHTVVVYLHKMTMRWYLPTVQELEEICQTPVGLRLADGSVFGMKE